MERYHYVYRITNVILNKHYYGVRSSKVEPKLDIGINYFSSSFDKNFIKDQKENPQNYKYKVIWLFKTRKLASLFEIKLHNKFDVGVNESFYNRSKSTNTGFCIAGINKTEEHKEKIRQNSGGWKHSEETKKYLSVLHTGVPKSEEQKRKMSEAQKKRTDNNYWLEKEFSNEHKEKIGKAHRGKKVKRVQCPHCKKIGAINGMKQWHFDNCKDKK